ncbi:hypothetical protein FACS189494_06260 [Spirochaetia bacterium]|nr:hypothetical protein FACS189494_06260 [Spirochaetia bacterium]
MEDNFYFNKSQDVFRVKNSEKLIDYDKLKSILKTCNYKDRVTKWFKVITEDDIINLLPNLGSNTFVFDNDIINMMVKDFNLILKKEYN